MSCIIPVKGLLNGQGWYAKVLGLFLSFYENLEWWEIKKKMYNRLKPVGSNEERGDCQQLHFSVRKECDQSY